MSTESGGRKSEGALNSRFVGPSAYPAQRRIWGAFTRRRGGSIFVALAPAIAPIALEAVKHIDALFEIHSAHISAW